MKAATPAQRVKLLQLLVVRHAIAAVPTLLDAAKDADPAVRIAALEGLGQLAGPEGVAKLAHLILDAKDATAREEAEKALMLITQRESKVKVDQRALPLLKVMSGLSEKDKTTLLSGARSDRRQARLEGDRSGLGRQGSGPQRGGLAGDLQLAGRQRCAAVGRTRLGGQGSRPTAS